MQDTDLSAHEETARSEVRDSHGHFASKPQTQTPSQAPSQTSQTPSNSLTNLLHNSTSVSKTSDDSTLIDVHIGNPLKKITHLL